MFSYGLQTITMTNYEKLMQIHSVLDQLSEVDKLHTETIKEICQAKEFLEDIIELLTDDMK